MLCSTISLTTMSEAIIVACIASVGGILAAIMQGLKKENKTDHAYVANTLDRIEGRMTADRVEGKTSSDRIETKIDTHVRDHATDQL